MRLWAHDYCSQLCSDPRKEKKLRLPEQRERQKIQSTWENQYARTSIQPFNERDRICDDDTNLDDSEKRSIDKQISQSSQTIYQQRILIPRCCQSDDGKDERGNPCKHILQPIRKQRISTGI